jgi:hypothetical protein
MIASVAVLPPKTRLQWNKYFSSIRENQKLSAFDYLIYHSALCLHMATSSRKNLDDLYVALSLYFWKKDDEVIAKDFQSVGKMIGNLKRLGGEFHVVDNDYSWLDLEEEYTYEGNYDPPLREEFLKMMEENGWKCLGLVVDIDCEKTFLKNPSSEEINIVYYDLKENRFRL